MDAVVKYCNKFNEDNIVKAFQVGTRIPYWIVEEAEKGYLEVTEKGILVNVSQKFHRFTIAGEYILKDDTRPFPYVVTSEVFEKLYKKVDETDGY